MNFRVESLVFFCPVNKDGSSLSIRKIPPGCGICVGTCGPRASRRHAWCAAHGDTDAQELDKTFQEKEI